MLIIIFIREKGNLNAPKSEFSGQTLKNSEIGIGQKKNRNRCKSRNQHYIFQWKNDITLNSCRIVPVILKIHVATMNNDIGVEMSDE